MGKELTSEEISIYAGVTYKAIREGNINRIVLSPQVRKTFGPYINLAILDNIGNDDPDDVMEILLSGLTKKKE